MNEAMENHGALLKLALRAAEGAGDLLRQALDREKGVDAEAGRDIKLELDRISEDRILEVLRSGTDWPVLAEERGELPGEGDTPWRWIVDPLDGSLNYFRGIPLCCVSIALYRGEEPVLGVVRDFLRGETHAGILGQGAWVNGRPAGVSRVAEKARGILCTGFPVATDFSAPAVTEFVRGVREWKKVRLLGSAALSLAWVACGRADAYFERDIKLWDVGAGLALVLAAGGRVHRRPKDRPNVLDVFASNHDLPEPEDF